MVKKTMLLLGILLEFRLLRMERKNTQYQG